MLTEKLDGEVDVKMKIFNRFLKIFYGVNFEWYGVWLVRRM